MLDANQIKDTPMGAALAELAEKMQERDMPPVSLNVVGGFALMMHGIRDASDTTDIDFVGKDLPADFNRVSDEIGMKHHLGKGWINNDVMLAGISPEDFEFSTGKLHFQHAFDIGGIQVNVLDEKDLLRMKLIAVDTSLSGTELGGEFTREKDLPDVAALMDRQGVSVDDLDPLYGDYVDQSTIDVIGAYRDNGIEAVRDAVAENAKAYQERLRASNAQAGRPAGRETSPYLQNLMSSLYAEADRRKSMEDGFGL